MSVGPFAILTTLTAHRGLIARLARRDIETRYAGALLGPLWPLLNALALLAIYTFMFGLVFKARWGGQGSTSDFALVLFAGLIPFNLFAEVVQRAPGLVVENAVYVKKVIFPLPSLAWIALAHAAFNALVALAVLLAALVVLKGSLPLTVLALPLVIVPLVLITLGVTWVLAALGVFARDLRHGVALAVTAAMFLSPLFYPRDAVPQGLAWVIALNPMTTLIEASRACLIFATWPDFEALGWLTAIAWALAWAALALFSRVQKGFADVL